MFGDGSAKRIKIIVYIEQKLKINNKSMRLRVILKHYTIYTMTLRSDRSDKSCF